MPALSKHFLNTPASLVLDSLEGLCSVNPQLALDTQNKIVYIKSHDRSKVALMCGGGSGHEPAHAAFVGEGILTSAVCGSVFASPNASQVRHGIDLIDNDKGTVIIVKNYTGDVLNFGLAKEQYAALHPEKADRVKFVIVGDDVSVGKTQGKIVGRRGLAGTVLVYKIAGALAHRGGSLDEVYDVVQWVAGNVATIGVSLEHTHVPGTAAPKSGLGESEIEIGMGIHNESGHRRVSPAPPLSELIPQLLDLLTSTSDPERSFVPFTGKDGVVLLINNLGGISELELGGVVAETRRALDARGFKASRILSGTFMTSLNMPGFSITLLRLPTQKDTSAPSASLLLSLLDDTPKTPAWKWSSNATPLPKSEQIVPAQKQADAALRTIGLKSADPKAFIENIKHAANGLIAAEPEITRMDSIAGDGDCGLTLKAGAEGVLKKIEEGSIDGNDVVRSVIKIAQIAEEAMGGTSGALYSIFFSGLAQGLQAQSQESGATITPQVWGEALSSALTKLYTYTRARPPSRTLVDPLDAFISAFFKDSTNFSKATKAAADAAEATKNIEAKAGRSAYVEGNRLKEEQIPDPGAWGVKTILESFSA
ncbi:Dak1 domain-containing protein [Crucibulum laeve]|uniref:Dak1 domain-containing protein n=1 Tax=Crucibulum laeve TaxID=68775 RepID=A0A5C3M545_9AGAR|nr:Dak1 domain-containing protein [Crucibulum laeve]